MRTSRPRFSFKLYALATAAAVAFPACSYAQATSEVEELIVTATRRETTVQSTPLAITALGENIKLAQKRAYETAVQIQFDGMQFRKDIGHRAISR